MAPTSVYVEEALRERSGATLLVLLTLTHPSMAVPIRATSDAVQTVSRGEVFLPAAFDYRPPGAADGAGASGQLSVSNVDRRIIAEVRQLPIEPPLGVLVETVLAADPDTVEASVAGVEIRDVTATAFRISGNLVADVVGRSPYPDLRFLPSTVPGVF